MVEYYEEQDLEDDTPESMASESVGSYMSAETQEGQLVTALGEAFAVAGISADMFVHRHHWVLESSDGKSISQVTGRCKCGAVQKFKSYKGLMRR